MIVKRDYSNIPLPHVKKAAPSAALPIWSVIDAVVLGLMTRIFILEFASEVGSLDAVVVHQILGIA